MPTPRARRPGGAKGLMLAAGGSESASRPGVATDTAPGRTALSGLTERDFQGMVVAGLRQRGYIVWIVPNMRMTAAGLPDLIAVHPDRAPLLMWELKTEKGRVRPAQKAALACLQNIPGIDARIVRPSDWHALSEEV